MSIIHRYSGNEAPYASTVDKNQNENIYCPSTSLQGNFVLSPFLIGRMFVREPSWFLIGRIFSSPNLVGEYSLNSDEAILGVQKNFAQHVLGTFTLFGRTLPLIG